MDKVKILMGQTVYVTTNAPEGTQWFFDNDEVLALDVFGSDAEIEAETTGRSTILLMDSKKNILKELSIEVVEAIEYPATRLDITVGTAEYK